MPAISTRLKIKHKIIGDEIIAFKNIFAEAKTVIFFTGFYLNRLPLTHDRDILHVAGYKLMKTNNYRLMSVLLSQDILKNLSQCVHSYTLIAISTQHKDLQNLETVFSLPYKYVKPFFALTKKNFFY